MTRAFLFINLTATNTFTYQQPELEWVKKTFPGTPTFDLDIASSNLLVNYAVRLLGEAERPVVYVWCPEEVPFAAVAPVLEEVIKTRPKCLVLLHGTHPRLQRMLQARPDLPFVSATEEQPLRERLQTFWQDVE